MATTNNNTSTFSYAGLFLGLLAAVALGIALFVASRIVYIYLFYNSIIGIGIGAAVAYGIGKAKYRETSSVVFITAICSFVAYLTFNMALMRYVFGGDTIGFFEFLRIRAENEPFLSFGQIGAGRNIIIWVVEFLITWYFAWQRANAKPQ